LPSPARIGGVEVATYRFPTDRPESDGTLTWDATEAVVVQVTAGGRTGLGWTYSSRAAAAIVADHLRDVVVGSDPRDVTGVWAGMVRACRNLGRPGVVSAAIAAVDIALWDLKARLLDQSLHRLFGAVRDEVPVYGSGGFVSMTDAELTDQIKEWAAAGCTAMKIKVGEDWGRRPDRDLARVSLLADRAPAGTTLMVDANGGYGTGEAKRLGAAYDEIGVAWFEEPVSSDDLAGLHQLRRALRCDVTAGEYADSVAYVERMVGSGAVDCLQIDVTRCAGYTEWLRCAAVAAAHNLSVSGHCAPALHAPVAAAVPNLRHVEWFADHVRLEPRLVIGLPVVEGGRLVLREEPGHGMTLADTAEDYRVAG
jgi:L-alanine-DL-glutamate epimerase-like enolase superfamily enzyme